MQDLYYIQDSRTYIGNSPSWWGKNGNGYVCDLDKAGLYTKQEAMKIFNDRNSDIPWKQKDVENAIKKIVNSQYLKKNDEDEFYTEIENIITANRNKEIIDNTKRLMKNYKEVELFIIMEQLELDDTEIDELSEEVHNAIEKVEDFCEYHYPTAYNKDSKELADDMLKFNLLFECDDCKNIKYGIDKDEDFSDKNICEDCGIERWHKNNE